MNFSRNRSSKSSKDAEIALSKPITPVEDPDPVEPASADEEVKNTSQDLPIPPAGEVMQYRAIGLVRGRYIPSLEQFTQGTLVSEDNTLINSVLLGRVMSLVKKHIDLSQNHLWVVYPRIGKEDSKLHLQIVGIWEPETLKNEEKQDKEADCPSETLKDGYFSIRGDVIYQSQDEPHLIVKIKQAARKQGEKPKFFKLKLQGSLADKMVGHFWELEVQRQGETLVIESGKDICELPKNKPIRKKFPPKKVGHGDSSRPIKQKPIVSKPLNRDSSQIEAHPPNLFRKPVPKPSKRQPPTN